MRDLIDQLCHRIEILERERDEYLKIINGISPFGEFNSKCCYCDADIEDDPKYGCLVCRDALLELGDEEAQDGES